MNVATLSRNQGGSTKHRFIVVVDSAESAKGNDTVGEKGSSVYVVSNRAQHFRPETLAKFKAGFST